MTRLSEARAEAKRLGVEIGSLTTKKDSQGEYTLFEAGLEVACGFYGMAAEIKADYVESLNSSVAYA